MYESKEEVEKVTDEESEEDSDESSKEESTDISKEGDNNYTCFEIFALVISYVLFVLTFPYSLIVCLKIIFEYERAVIFRLGKLRKGARGPGLIFILFCTDECFIADLRTETVNIFPQQMLTKDSMSIRLEAVIFFRLQDAIRGVVAVGNYRYATILLAQTALRNIAAEKTLLELLLERAEISRLIQEVLVEGTDPWGVVVERVEIKNIRLPVDLQRAMAAEAEAMRLAKANIVNAEGEKIAANALKIASDTISSSPGAIQMRYLQTLRFCMEDESHIYVLPFSKEVCQFCKGFVSSLGS